MPNLVCNAQLTTAVSVTGSGLTPVPTRTLAGGEVLAAPTVTLAMSTDLGGNAMSAQPVTLNDPTDTSNTHVRWESEMQMSFDVTPDEMLAAGVYDVTLTNPDGRAATLAQSLAVVPPPSITAVMPMNICDDQAVQTITITGQNFLVVGDQSPEVDVFDANGMAVFTATATASNCTAIAASLNEAIQECTTLTFQVPVAAIPVGMYTVSVTNPAPAACASTEKVAFTVEPPPTLTSVQPATLCVGGGTLTLTGTHFMPTAMARLSDPATGQKVDAASNVINAAGTEDVARFLISGGLTVNDFVDVTIDNGDGCSATLQHAVQVIAGPIIFYVDPPYVYDGITTPVTVYTTGGITTLKSVTLTPHGQPNATPIDVTAASKIDPQHPAHVIIDVPGNPTLADGSYDLTIVNQGDCPAFYANAITVEPKSNVALAITPRFGSTTSTTAVTITAATDFFKGGARAYFAQEGVASPTAIPLSSVVYHDPRTLTAVVPSGLAAAGYDVIVVDPDGTIGFLGSMGGAAPFTVVNADVPVIDPQSPGSLSASCSGTACDLPLTGQFFNSTAVVSATCTTSAGATSTLPSLQLTPITATSIPLNLGGAAALGAGTVCTFHLVETVGAPGVSVTADGGSLVVRNASLNLSSATTAAKNDLMTPRRGHGMGYTGPTASARYLYVYGGDNGTTTTPGTIYSSGEFVEVDPLLGGTKSAWSQIPDSTLASPTEGALPTGTTFLGSATVGRYVYALGGMTGTTAATANILRAESLDPGESPLVTDADLTAAAPEATGVVAGLYFYRVSALMSATDDLNAGGETLASDEFAINVPSFGTNKIQVHVYFGDGPDIGARVVTGYRVYRTTNPNAAPGSEDQYADVTFAPGTNAPFHVIDVGTGVEIAGSTAVSAWTTQKHPLPFGALGNWTPAHAFGTNFTTSAVTLSTPRGAPAVAHVVVGGNDVLYVAYGETGSVALASYDVLSVAAVANGSSPVKVPSETLSVSGATTGLSTARYLAGGWGVMDTPSSPQVWFGPGTTFTGTANDFTSCAITPATLQLSSCANQGNVGLYAYGAIEAVEQLFAFGGVAPGGLTDKIGSVDLTGVFNFTPQGGGTIQYPAGTGYNLAYEGASLGGPYFWVTGGVTTGGLSAKVFYELY